MGSITLIMCLLIAVAAGLGAGLLIGTRGTQQKTVKINVLMTQVENLKRQLEDNKASANEMRQQQQAETEKQLALAKQDADRRLQDERVQWQSRMDAERTTLRQSCQEALDEKQKSLHLLLENQQQRHQEELQALKTRFDETLEKMVAQTKDATGTLLRDSQREMSESSRNSLGLITDKLKEEIEQMKNALNNNTVKSSEMNAALRENLDNMMKQCEAQRQSAGELARALKHGTKVQGDWGETVLNSLLQQQGLTEGIHYDVQPVIKDSNGNIVRTEEGRSLRPDVILHLDNNREVIIDSKVSLTAFIDYVNADNEEDRAKALKSHIESLERHVKELSEKDYSSYIQPPKVKMDYVIMFVPNTGALWTALNEKPDLWRRAMDKNVYIADEQTLFAALKIINMTWRQIAQAQNHEKVYQLANEMMDRVGQFTKKYDALGKALDTARKAYDDGGKKLSPTGQSIIQTCRKLEKLGARQSKKNPIKQIQSDLDEDMDEEEPDVLPDKDVITNKIQ